MNVTKMTDLDLRGKRVLIRQDLNVPVADGTVTSDARIRAALPTIEAALAQGARVMLMSHLGRPEEGRPTAEASLAPVAQRLSELMHREVRLEQNWLDGVEVAAGEVVLCENVRFLVGEKANDPELAQRMASLCDVFVMDAFGTAHRAQASTEGVAHYASVACAGPLLVSEVESIESAFVKPARPLVVIVGGAKVSTKLGLLDFLTRVADRVIVGGGIANTFLAAAGCPVGRSLYEPDLVEAARRIHDEMRDRGGEIPLPIDVVCAREVTDDAETRTCEVANVGDDDMILDIGPRTRESLASLLHGAGTIVWNGPVGVFEKAPFAEGTRTLATAIAASKAFSLAGGGDTLAAIDCFGVRDDISYISTGGGAFLEMLEGKKLPAVAALERRIAAGAA